MKVFSNPKSNQIKFNQIRSNQITSNIKSNQTKPHQFKNTTSFQIKNQIKFKLQSTFKIQIKLNQTDFKTNQFELGREVDGKTTSKKSQLLQRLLNNTLKEHEDMQCRPSSFKDNFEKLFQPE